MYHIVVGTRACEPRHRFILRTCVGCCCSLGVHCVFNHRSTRRDENRWGLTDCAQAWFPVVRSSPKPQPPQPSNSHPCPSLVYRSLPACG